ncbi:hypothetical protein HYH02_010524 [Chlamydomonas schloesseri]|uniref:Anaphase-promoting complex subunit 4 WD40 domain-containing protein n=1 Tax=Chlamydomonas schloesseri TaxID=2026947 RepID=A0A835TGH3_9CHLO|nr:hypothetical protein HYH02_010524 [Chlamydomonas schloesseri]|eukprot:KAG2439894.1 hypothetical protein HYH02_010524 [Chlamydomonas schloesseri]
MDFSESFRSSGPPPAFSPDGRFVATVVEYRLIIREVETLRVVQLYSCLDRIDSIEWSCNSAYVLCGLCSRGVIQIWSTENSEWTCKIDEGPAGVQAVRWSPDGACVLVVAEFGLRVTVWDLVDKRCTYLRGPKHGDGRGLAFSGDGRWLAVLERAEMRDWVTVYDCSSRASAGNGGHGKGGGGGWGEAARFQLPTADAADIAWSPAGGVLAAWESCLSDKVVTLDAGSGSLLGCYTCSSSSSGGAGGGKDCLGIKCVSWSATGELLAVGGYDGRLRLLNAVTWAPLLEAEHGGRVAAPAALVVYREELSEPAPQNPRQPASAGATPTSRGVAAAAAAADPNARTHYAIGDLPAAVPGHKPAPDAPGPPKLGVGRCMWSADGRYAASVEDCRPGAVWVWDAGAMELCALLVHLAPVTDLAWGPRGHTLAVATGTTRVYLWTPAGASIIHIPLPNFQAFGCAWNNTATTLLLRGPEAFCCAYLTA